MIDFIDRCYLCRMTEGSDICYCPNYNVGLCDVFSGRRAECTYCDEAHVPCEYNHLCEDMECILGHSVSKRKREMIIKIYNDCYNGNDINECCIHHYNCVNRYCMEKHTIDDFNIRKTVCNIIRGSDDDDAEWYYDTFYVRRGRGDKVNNMKNIKTHHIPMFKRTDLELSEASTSSMTKPPVSPVVSYEMISMKNMIEDDAIIDIDNKENVLDLLTMVVPSMREKVNRTEDIEDIKVEEIETCVIKKEELVDLKNELKAFILMGEKLVKRIEELEK
jgi:hypothetical protein